LKVPVKEFVPKRPDRRERATRQRPVAEKDGLQLQHDFGLPLRDDPRELVASCYPPVNALTTVQFNREWGA